MTKSASNLVFIHCGNPDYLKWALLQAHRSNPKATIHILGDESNNKYDFAVHHTLEDYMGSANEFEKCYEHYSTNPYSFELLCLQRYFILKDFLSKTGIERCYHPDSDVMIFFDYEKEYEYLKKYEFTVVTDVPSMSSSGHSGFWNSLGALERFCASVMDTYTKRDQKTFDRLVGHYNSLQKRGKAGGICCMTNLFVYRERYPERVGELTELRDNTTFDVNLNAEGNGKLFFKKHFGVKKIDWIGGLPYGTVRDTGEKIRFKILHCQGGIKKYMGRVYARKPIVPFWEGVFLAIKVIAKRVKRKYRHLHDRWQNRHDPHHESKIR